MEKKVEDFFRRVLSPRGFPCLVSLRKGSAPDQQPQESIAYLLNNVEKEIERCAYANRDLYFCISTLKQRSLIDATGKTRVRVSNNCFETRSLILDIDVDPAGYLKGDQSRIAYASQEEAA